MKYLNILILTIVLSACSLFSNVPNHYYRLSQSAFVEPKHAQVQINVQVSPYLQTRSLVYAVQPNELAFADHHLWIEDVNISVAKVLANKLNTYQPIYTVLATPNTRKLLITLEQFYGMEGKVIVKGFARYFSLEGKQRGVYNFAVEVSQRQDGYNAMVQSLNSALHLVAQQLNQYSKASLK